MNQTWENGWFWPKFGLQKFFRGFYLYYMVYIVSSYHCMQFQRKLMNQTWEMAKKLFLGRFSLKFVSKNIFLGGGGGGVGGDYLY